MLKIGFIGFGNMGQAIAQGLIRTNNYKLNCYDVSQKALDTASKKMKITTCSSSQEVINNSDITILAVKPQYMEDVLQQIGSDSKGKKIISIAAGISIDFYAKYLKTEDFIRFMPNMAAAAQASTTAICPALHANQEFIEESLKIAESFGEGFLLSEKLIPAFIGVSGSGIAYVFSFLHSMALGGTREGLTYQQSLEIALKTVKGAAEVVEQTQEHPVSILSKVISPAGTTIEGIAKLENSNFSGTIVEAVSAAAQKARNF